MAALATATHDDRRDSSRTEQTFLVLDLGIGGSFEEQPGDLGISGALLRSTHPPSGSSVELRFTIPSRPGEIRAKGDVIAVSEGENGFRTRVKFTEIDMQAELALARYMESLARIP